MIPFNKPYLTGKEAHYLYEAVSSGKISGNGLFTKRCHQFFEQRYGFHKTLLTTSCTDALEMAALLLRIQQGDEIIMPSYTFVSTANAFVLRGAKIIFADSYPNNPNIDPTQIEALITPKTKAIVVVHYAGIACDMDAIMRLSRQYKIPVVEDAAQAIDSFYEGRPLGSIGDLGAFSFHETKNIISGEGGMLVINNPDLVARAEIIWEKGTNRAAFFRGEVDKYGWIDIGSSFLPAETVAAFLYSQLEHIDDIQHQRKAIWQQYYDGLQSLAQQGYFQLPLVPSYATNNGHLFYLVCRNLAERSELIHYLRQQSIHPVFHYLSLHQSNFYKQKHDGRILENCDKFAERLVRLPLFYELQSSQINYIIEQIHRFFSKELV
jgi:dTDP-4-amino-4,6-dideoxygalactose transaminase